MEQPKRIFVKNNFINRVFDKKNILENQILEDNKSLKNVAPLRKFHVDYSNQQDSDTLEKLGHNPEYISPNEGNKTEISNGITIPKGKMLVDDNPQNPQFVNVNYPGKYTTLINKQGLSEGQIKSLATNDFTSHALHGDENYDILSKQLENNLLTKYSPEMIKGNGGIDAYIRGIISTDDEYQPYRDEMKDIDPSLLDNIKNYIKTGEKKTNFKNKTMPDPVKKIFVKVAKKSDLETDEAKKGIVYTESPEENKIELTKKYSDGIDAMKDNLDKTPSDIKEDNVQGISINKDTMKATPKIFVRKVVSAGGENGTTKIISSDGKSTVYEGRTNMQATKNALALNNSQTKDTDNRRDYNANNYNNQSGAKTNRDDKDIDSLVKLGKAVKK